MTTDSVTTKSIDYLQRRMELSVSVGDRATTGNPAARRMLCVRSIGRRSKDFRPLFTPGEQWRPASAALIGGLYGYRIPLAFSLTGWGAGVEVAIGSWSARADAAMSDQDRRRGILESVLRGLYPVVNVDAMPHQSGVLPLSGLVLGVPAPPVIDEADGSAPIDRVVRALSGTSWHALVLAYPVSEGVVANTRAGILNEMRAIEAAAQAEGAPSPLADQYKALLTLSLKSTSDGLATGMWRTAVYLVGDAESYPRLATVWRSVFSGEKSLPEPVRVFDRSEARGLAHEWLLPDADALPGPGHYRRSFEFQTLLTTTQLSSYVHLPEIEAPGFAIDLAPRFDTVAKGKGDFALGHILSNDVETNVDYKVSLRSLTRHAFVAGTTGSGKTNTIFSLLTRADAEGVPFLVIEPAKTEYRAMIENPALGARVRVLTPGKLGVAPLVMNPFEVPPGTAVSEHLDLVRAAFGAAFGMWTPLPQILERCLHEVYTNRGWDLRTNTNSRLRGDEYSTDAFPTVSDLVAKVGEVIPLLGYDDKVTGDLRAALTTRLESLRRGAKGAMLDVTRSIPIEDLLSAPTIIELEAMGDEGDKAFLAGLLLIRLAEFRRAQGQRDDLVHLLVIEEAHRLLSSVGSRGGEEIADPRGQAVETFSNLLSEIRAYGQGVIVADQIPVRLAPDVIKNTTLKIAHRIVSVDDRTTMGSAMALEDSQARALTTLAVGDAAVFGEEDDSALLVRIPLAKNPLAPTPPTDSAVALHMGSWREWAEGQSLLRPRPFCAVTCVDAQSACDAARTLCDDEFVQRTLSRTVLSMTAEPGALERLWPDLVGVVRARRPAGVNELALLRAVAGHGADWLANRRGAQAAWSFADTETFRARLQDVLLAKAMGHETEVAVTSFQLITTALHARDFEPYPACAHVCAQDPPLCLYRSTVADLVAGRRYRPAWLSADEADATSEDNRRRQTWEICQDAAYELMEFPDEEQPANARDALERAARQVCLCFEQQMLADDRRKVPRTSRRILARVLEEAGM